MKEEVEVSVEMMVVVVWEVVEVEEVEVIQVVKAGKEEGLGIVAVFC